MKTYTVSDINRKMREVIKISIVVAILLLIFSVFYLKIFSVLNSMTYLLAYLVVVPIVYLSSLLSRWMLIKGREKLLVKKSLIVLMINLTVGVILTGRLQILGVIIGTLSAEIFGLFILWRHAK